jgi:hypothetical protein
MDFHSESQPNLPDAEVWIKVSGSTPAFNLKAEQFAVLPLEEAITHAGIDECEQVDGFFTISPERLAALFLPLGTSRSAGD